MGKAVGDEMLTRYVVPFEVAGLLLTAALVGAIALAHREGDDHSPRLGAIETVTAGTTEGSDLQWARPRRVEGRGPLLPIELSPSR